MAPSPLRPRRIAARAPYIVLALALAAVPAAAQTAGSSAAPQSSSGKQALQIADFDQWNSIRGETLSPDGKWVAYSLQPQAGDGELVVHATSGDTEYRQPQGFTGRPQLKVGAARGDNFMAPRPRFSADSRYVLFLVEPPRTEVERAWREKKKPAEQPKASLAIMSLADGRVTVIPRVKSFKLAEDAGRYVAYQLEADSAREAQAQRAPGRAAAEGQGGASARKKPTGSTLVLRDLSTGAETRIEDVASYALDERGKWLGYAVTSAETERDGAFVRSLETGAVRPLLSGPGDYKALAFDKAGTQAAFVSDRDEFGKADVPRYALYAASLADGSARRLVGAADAGPGLVVSDHATPEFTDDGRVLRFGVAPTPREPVPTDSLWDKAVFDLWSYRDARLQPQQKVDARDDRTSSFLAVYQLGSNRYVRIGSDTFPQAELSEDGRVAMIRTRLPYAIEATWGEGGQDVYAVDATTGERKLVAHEITFEPELSPEGRYVLYFDQEKWFAYDVASGKTVDLTAKMPGVGFAEETWDRPSERGPWGVGGWTKDDASVLLYDRYDVWEVDPSGQRAPRVLTDSLGRKYHLVFRVVKLDDEHDWLDPKEPLLLSATDEETKAAGFWRDRLGATSPPQKLVMADKRFGRPLEAENADVLLWTESTVSEFPNLWASDEDFQHARKLSDANPQQSRYNWATVELVHWRSDDGTMLKGLLYKPEDFDASKKYPMLVYYYESLSQNRYAYVPPSGRNVINPLVYASDGYLVFEPDIHYETGHPGQSALRSVVPGVQMLIDRGYVDPNAVGLQGHSWGGYQTAYIITQTPMFKAAMAGAPVSNMTSAYGGIRWGSGNSRESQYEHGQSRIGGSLWEKPLLYLENSPLFSVERIQTPLLIMHNDGDGAVPWYQGIELFMAMRRLKKEVYLIDYNGEEHNPTKRANQLDIARRMKEFFDYHLRGAPEPEWMKDGIPYRDKGRDQLARPAVSAAATSGAGH